VKLRGILLQGFKSFGGEEGQTIPLGDVTVLLGANGSGKSNLVSFFQMLHFMTTGALQQYVGKQGASRLLFYGPKISESIAFELYFDSQEAHDTYSLRLSYGLPDRLFVSGERVLSYQGKKEQPQEYFLESGGSESGLREDTRKTSKVLYGLLSGIRTYQFHDTSETAKIKRSKDLPKDKENVFSPYAHAPFCFIIWGDHITKGGFANGKSTVYLWRVAASGRYLRHLHLQLSGAEEGPGGKRLEPDRRAA
jgi:predicted ATPase